MATKFLKKGKQIKKDLMPTIIENAERGAGAIGAAFLSNSVLQPIATKNAEKTIGKILNIGKGPAMFLLGTATDLMVTEKNVKCIGQGIATYGLLESAGLVIPKAKLFPQASSVAGLGANEDDMVSKIAAEAEAEYNRQVEEATAGIGAQVTEDVVNDDDDDEQTAGLSTSIDL